MEARIADLLNFDTTKTVVVLEVTNDGKSVNCCHLPHVTTETLVKVLRDVLKGLETTS